jgi:pimeloyl-ACP methyl ester carboxylesterase
MKVYKSEEGKKAIYDSYDALVRLWGVETEGRDLEGSFGKTHVILAGDPKSPPLLLFHGVGDDSALMWIKNAEALSKSFRLIAIDTMGGAGRSVPGGRYEEGFDLASWYGEVLVALGIDEAYAAGVSYGSYHCQLLMLRYPERIKRIVGISGFVAAKDYERSKLYAMRKMMKVFLPIALAGTKERTLAASGRLFGPNSESILGDEEIGEHFWLLLKQYRSQAQFNHERPSFSAEELDSIRDKSLFLVGTDDILVSLAEAERVNEYLKMNLKAVEGAGHAANHTKPREIEAEIVGFLLGR